MFVRARIDRSLTFLPELPYFNGMQPELARYLEVERLVVKNYEAGGKFAGATYPVSVEEGYKLLQGRSPRCPECSSTLLYIRLRANVSVCRRCGHVWPIEPKADNPQVTTSNT